MVEPRQSAMQRVQVGLIGLVVVLMFVTLANMVLDRVTGGSAASNATAISPTTTEIPDEPLAELGVTPVAKEDAEPTVGSSPRPSRNTEKRPAGSRR